MRHSLLKGIIELLQKVPLSYYSRSENREELNLQMILLCLEFSGHPKDKGNFFLSSLCFIMLEEDVVFPVEK